MSSSGWGAQQGWEEEDYTKSCSQFVYEQVSDAQNWQDGDKNIRFEIPSIQKPR